MRSPSLSDMDINRPAIPRIWLLIGLLCGLAWGCRGEQQPEAPAATSTPKTVGEVKLLVVDDPEMAAAIDQLQAEWKARTGATIVIEQMNSAELESAEKLPNQPDGIIYPSRLLGSLAERGWIVPLPDDYATHRELAWTDTFELLQVAETSWSNVPHAVPFGSPVLTCYFRTDLVEPRRKTAPRSWEEYHKLADLLGRRENLGATAPAADMPWHGSLQPLANGWAGRILLARAAAYAKHRDHYSTLFEVDTMRPLISGPAFVRALEELLADAQLGPAGQIEMNPDDVRREFLAGHAALAITWPGHVGTADDPKTPYPATGFAELPGSPVVYNFAHESWEKRQTQESWHVPLLATSGRMGSVASQASQSTNAFQILAWLSGREWGPKVSSASRSTTLYRRSQVRAPQPWLDPGTDAAAGQAYAASVNDALNRQQYLIAPRIPGEAQYMEALDAAVHVVLRQEILPADALKQAAERWHQITESLGTEAQKSAYRRSLGL